MRNWTHLDLVDIPTLRPLRYDVAYSGNIYAFVDAANLGVASAVNTPEREAGLAVMAAINERNLPPRPLNQRRPSPFTCES